ncbi:UNVERIFIED_CONTAM: hypothetical protein Sradi_1847900 [Sesamum radiatum]|uniref:Uncharacterized protein n=1 Tax=Sesamum radiatum TaxID=300843 RepID=A0AAW2TVW3_SESRA
MASPSCHGRYWSYSQLPSERRSRETWARAGERSWASEGHKLGAQPIAGVAKSVLIKVGPFEGKTNLSAVVMDDFKLILGLDFLRDTRTAVLPHVDSLMMMGANLVLSPRWRADW